MLFFGAFTGANVLRHDPPDRYVFNYRASYAEETDAVVRYLVKLRRIPPRQIAVFAQQDTTAIRGFAGVAKAVRSLGVSDATIVRLNYSETLWMWNDAVNQLKLQKPPIKRWSWCNLSRRARSSRSARPVSWNDLFTCRSWAARLADDHRLDWRLLQFQLIDRVVHIHSVSLVIEPHNRGVTDAERAHGLRDTGESRIAVGILLGENGDLPGRYPAQFNQVTHHGVGFLRIARHDS